MNAITPCAAALFLALAGCAPRAEAPPREAPAAPPAGLVVRGYVPAEPSTPLRPEPACAIGSCIAP